MLIFVGISLALAFDNWNNERSARASEREYLQSIYSNLNSNFQQIDENLTFNSHCCVKTARNVANFVRGEAFDDKTLLDDFGAINSY